MRAALLLLLSVAAPAALARDAAAQGASRPAPERALGGRPAGPEAAIRVFNLAGPTRIVGWDRDSIAVTGTVPPAAGRFYIGGTRDAVKLGVEGEGAAEAALEVRVPRRARVWVKGAAGSIEVAGVEGELDLYSVAGDVRVRGRPAQLTAETIDGDVDLADGAGSARLKTAAGAVTVAGRVSGLTVGSVSGPVRVALERVQRGEISTVTGSVHFRGALAADGLLDVVTHEASVTLVLPADTQADFELRTFDGILVNRFGREAGRFSRGKPFRFSTRRAAAGDDPASGGARVAVRTLKGDISLFRR